MAKDTLKGQYHQLLNDEAYTICATAVDTLGVTTRINKAKEALSVLHLELDRLQSNPILSSMDGIVKGIAEVAIAIQQLAIIYNTESVLEEITRQLNVLEDTIDAFDKNR